MLPVVLVFFELREQKLKGAAVYLMPFGVVMAVYFGVRAVVVGIPQEVSFNANLFETILVGCTALATYLRLLIAPYPLQVFYPKWDFVSIMQTDLLLSLAFCLLLAYVLWKLKDDSLLAPLLFGIVILLVPVVVKANKLVFGLTKAFIAERQLYVPAILFSLFIAALINRFVGSHINISAVATAMLVLPLYIYITIGSCAVWNSNDALIARFTSKSPDSYVARNSRAGILFKQGDMDGALLEYNALLPSVKALVLSGQGAGSTSGKSFEGMTKYCYAHLEIAGLSTGVCQSSL